MMNETQVFELLGVTERELAVYKSLLRLGPASIRDIASNAGINRGVCYEVLKKLQDNGIVTLFPKGKRRLFCAEPVEKLLQLAEEKQQQMSTAFGLLKTELVPDLRQLVPVSDHLQVHYYEGDDGIERVLKDILRSVELQKNKSYSVYSSRAIRKYLYRPFPHYTRQRVQKGIAVRVIAIGEGGEEAPLSQRKWINAGNTKIAASYVAIYPPKCAMISLTEGDYPSAVVLESAGIAAALQLSFDTLWGLL